MIPLKHKKQSKSLSQCEKTMIIHQVIWSQVLHMVLDWCKNFFIENDIMSSQFNKNLWFDWFFYLQCWKISQTLSGKCW